MINFIIYEDERKFREEYVSTILKVVGGKNFAYKIHEIEKYEKNTIEKINKIIGKKIFILDIEVPGKSGLDFAKEIRTLGDWDSQIIVISTHEYMKYMTFTSRLLCLDFISKYYNSSDLLKECLELSLSILNKHQSLNFQYNGEIYQIPYDDILFIERNVDDNYSTIVTKTKKIVLNKLLGTIEDELKNDSRFFRSHRSYIVNTNKIASVKLKECMIMFDNNISCLLSREKKAELKSKLLNQ